LSAFNKENRNGDIPLRQCGDLGANDSARIGRYFVTVGQPQSRRERLAFERAHADASAVTLDQPPVALLTRSSIRRATRSSVRPAARWPTRQFATKCAPRTLRNGPLPKLMVLACMLFAGGMFVATSIPANALMPAAINQSAPPQAVAASTGATQKLTVETESAIPVQRDRFSVTSADQIYRLGYQRANTFTNNPFGSIQWPFAVGVPLSSLFGERVSPCSGCSSFHEGLDFVPGPGAPIQAIADGVVSMARDYGSELGTEVTIDHVINWVAVQSVYGHMKRGSTAVAVGQRVKVGQLVGLVGQTGVATGPHLHLEIRINGVPVNPLAWLRANTN
jgi:murein DD-endopeptidase MepM/ murein hydrolase activator NlpD